MKKTKKILIMLAIFLISIGVVGCSSNKEEDKKNIATQKKENKSSKLSGEEIFKKVNDATKEIKSSKRKMDYSEIMSAAGKKTETLVNTEAITTDNPSITKLYSTVNLLEKNLVLNHILPMELFMLKMRNQMNGLVLKMRN